MPVSLAREVVFGLLPSEIVTSVVSVYVRKPLSDGVAIDVFSVVIDVFSVVIDVFSVAIDVFSVVIDVFSDENGVEDEKCG